MYMCKTSLIIAHIIIHCPKYSTSCLLLNIPSSLEKPSLKTTNIFKFFKQVDLENKTVKTYHFFSSIVKIHNSM